VDAVVLLAAVLGLAVVVISFVPCRWGGARRSGELAARSALVGLAIATIVTGCGVRPSPITPTSAVPPTTQPPTMSAPSPSAASPTPVSLEMDATGLGPCTQPWYTSCNYGIRIEGPGGYDHRGNFAWDEGRPPDGQLEHGQAGPVASTGIWGDLPAALGPGVWTISFRLWYGSDAVSFAPVPGGTPRYAQEDPFTAACSTDVDTAGVASVNLHVAFQGPTCTVVTQIARP
jgi:hypothetical protein